MLAHQWVAYSTPHTRGPDALSPDVLSYCALSPRALSPNGLRNTWKNQSLQVDFFSGIYPKLYFNIIYQRARTFIITFYYKAHSHIAHQYSEREESIRTKNIRTIRA